MNLALGLAGDHGPHARSESPRERDRTRWAFGAAGVAAGLKATGEPDLAARRQRRPAAPAPQACSRRNRCKANPVLWSEQASRRHRPGGRRSTPAAPTATPAPRASRHPRTAELAADLLGRRRRRGRGLLDRPDRRCCTTGSRCSPASRPPRPRSTATGGRPRPAIMTTDTGPSRPRSTAPAGTSAAMAKGAGMLAPALATMLVVLTTDAGARRREQSTPPCAHATSRRLRPARLRRLHVDQRHRPAHGQRRLRRRALRRRADARARRRSAATWRAAAVATPRAPTTTSRSTSAARRARTTRSRSAARSPAATSSSRAIYGSDPNWGRILAAVGTTQAAFDPADLDVAINGVWVCRESGPGEPRDRVDLASRAVTSRSTSRPATRPRRSGPTTSRTTTSTRTRRTSS